VEIDGLVAMNLLATLYIALYLCLMLNVLWQPLQCCHFIIYLSAVPYKMLPVYFSHFPGVF